MPILVIGEIDIAKIKTNLKISVEDYWEIDEPVIKIAQIRELLHFINTKPFRAPVKLIFVRNADRMTHDAANALLKTLEETPEYARIVLQTLNEGKLLPTILSRCQKITGKPQNNFPEFPDYLSPEEIKKKSVAEKFKWAAKIADQDQVKELLILWQEYFRKKLIQGEDCQEILIELAKAKDLLQSNISLKLLVENLTLEMSKNG